MSNATDVIAQAITRLNADYDAALREAGYDESIIAFYLPGEWVILARRTLELIVAEVLKRAQIRDQVAPGAEPCPGCDGRLWMIAVDPRTLLRHVRCASCGMASHV